MNLNFNEKINILKAKINIVEVIGKYLTLIHKGNNFWALCPFHEDSEPSLSISQEKQIYKCFSCGEQGNVFIFLQKYKNINFINALQEIAKSVNINLKDFDINLNDNKNEIKEDPLKIINNVTMNFFSYQLLTVAGEEAISYLQKRSITLENIKEFNIGYAPKNNKLLDYLDAQGYNIQELINLGLVKISSKDKMHDAFINRIIFAIKDENENCVGFSARSYNIQDKSSKYINSSETDFFKKSKLLYNLNNVRKYLNKNSLIYLVEGFMDVIALHNVNIKTSVALMGTNLTKEHVLLLKKFTKSIIIFLDGDNPGKIASLKIANFLLANEFKVQIINNDTIYDPDELVNNFSKQFQTIITKTLHPFEFAINFFLNQYDIKKDSYQLNEFLKSLKPFWINMSDFVSKKFYLDMLAKITTLKNEDLLQVLNIEKKFNTQKKVTNSYNKLPTKNILLEAQEQLLFLVMISKDVYLLLEKAKFIFPNQDYMNIYFLLSKKYQNEKIKNIHFNDIIKEFKNNSLLLTVEKIISKHKTKIFDVKAQIVNDYLRIINNQIIEYEIKNLNNKLKFEQDINNQIKILKEISVLKIKIKKN